MDSDMLTVGELNQFFMMFATVVVVLTIGAITALAISLWQERDIKEAIRRANNEKNK